MAKPHLNIIRVTSMLIASCVISGCILQTETVSGPPDDDQSDAGVPGPQGEPGPPGVSPFSYVDPVAMTDIYYSTGKVCIGTSEVSPAAELSVAGAVAVGFEVGTASLTGGGSNNVLVHGRSAQSSTTSGIQFGDNDNSDSRQFAILNGNDGVTQKAGHLLFVSSSSVNLDPLSGSGFVIMDLMTYPNPGAAITGNVSVSGAVQAGTLDVDGTARLKSYDGVPPFDCDDTRYGTIALDGNYDICVCKPAGWVYPGGGSACAW